MHERKLAKTRKKMTSSGIHKPGFLFIISAPSGAGKSTLCHAVLDRFTDLVYSVSYTTRSPRSGEQNGVDYHFIVKEEFEKGIASGHWAEWAEVHNHYYGTSADFLDGELSLGRDILLDIDLKSRLQSRGTDSPEVIAVRLKNARKEMAQKDLYRHIITNDRLADAVAELIAIFEKYRS
jgi:guanylate kinase